MTPLPNDVCRCTGVDGGFVCPERDTCKRYIVFTQRDGGQLMPARVPCMAALKDCQYKIEVSNEQ
jgi:hypothetical protein